MSEPKEISNGASSRFLEPRTQTDSWVTEKTLRDRAITFSLLPEKSIEKLEKPSLISSAHGKITGILMTPPWWLFIEKGDFDPIDFADTEIAKIKIERDTLFSIIKDLPSGTEITFLTTENVMNSGTLVFSPVKRLEAILKQVGRKDSSKIISAPDGLKHSVWAEDAYAMSNDLSDSETFFVEPASFRRGDDALIADLVASKSSIIQSQTNLYFQGGNILIGDDFWFIGTDYPKNSLTLGYVKPQNGETEVEAVTRAYSDALDHDRKFIQIGSRLPVPSEIEQRFILHGEVWSEKLYRANKTGTAQPLFHIDMFLTLGGRDDDGRYRVFVGDPDMAAGILGEQTSRYAMASIFSDIADQLEAMDFKVVRNPLPLTYIDDPSEKHRSWYFATSNNALVEIDDQNKTVWLPTYGHRIWPELKKTDDANKEIWKSEGFKVIQLGDFHPYAENLGAAHCITKYIDRTR
ncbi:hypothetical protein [Sphingorhabdus sp. Alg231-15]|uniref:hypothetical protein n=1 Tax=Sphingorhabdus sp. Alg231-15 TaxID=1922222 RepID=UPI000D55EF51